MYTDLFVHQLTHLIQAMGVRFPRRVVGAGGLYLEYDGRDVPDVATVVADYDEGCQVIISATMCNDVQLGEVIRGHTGDDQVRRQPEDGFRVVPQKLEGRPAPPGSQPGRGRRARSSPTQPARRHPRPLGPLPRVRPLAQPGDPLPGRTRLRRDRHGQPGRRSRTARARPTTSTRRPARSPTPTTRGPTQLGEAQPRPRQAQPGHRLEGRRTEGSTARAARTTRSSKATGSTARTPPRRPDARPLGSTVDAIVTRPRPGRSAGAARLSFAVRLEVIDATASTRAGPASTQSPSTQVALEREAELGPRRGGGTRPGSPAGPARGVGSGRPRSRAGLRGDGRRAPRRASTPVASSEDVRRPTSSPWFEPAR